MAQGTSLARPTKGGDLVTFNIQQCGAGLSRDRVARPEQHLPSMGRPQHNPIKQAWLQALQPLEHPKSNSFLVRHFRIGGVSEVSDSRRGNSPIMLAYQPERHGQTAWGADMQAPRLVGPGA